MFCTPPASQSINSSFLSLWEWERKERIDLIEGVGRPKRMQSWRMKRSMERGEREGGQMSLSLGGLRAAASRRQPAHKEDELAPLISLWFWFVSWRMNEQINKSNEEMRLKNESEMEWMKRSKPNNKPKEMKIEFLWFLLALPAALNERNGAQPKEPKAPRQAKAKHKTIPFFAAGHGKPAKKWSCCFAAEGWLVWFVDELWGLWGGPPPNAPHKKDKPTPNQLYFHFTFICILNYIFKGC